jgi:F-type H+-transporting ATPase subunit gamma
LPSLKDIRRRIRSVKSTQQITRAMKMVAAAKLRKAQERLTASRAYAKHLEDLMIRLALRVGPDAHPFFKKQPVERTLVLLVTGDRGLCGAYNANLFHAADHLIRERGADRLEFIMAGKKGADHFRKAGLDIRQSYPNVFLKLDQLPYEDVAREARDAYLSGRVQEMAVLSMRFQSISNSRIETVPILPLAPAPGDAAAGIEYLTEPSLPDVLDALIPRYLNAAVLRALLEANAAEQAARMTAMELATRNADEMIDSLTLFYNRARQAAITKELIEIVSGAQSL